MEILAISLLIAICSVSITILIINTLPAIRKNLSAVIDTVVITIKSLPDNIKDIYLVLILALSGSAIAIFVLNIFFKV